MRARAFVVVAAIAGAGAPAVAAADTAPPASFETLAQAAVPVHALDELAWALTAHCDRGSDVEQRQCREIRDAKQRELANATLLVDADPEALHLGAWNPQKKQLPLTLSACVRCDGVAMPGDGGAAKPLYIVGGNAPTVVGGRVKATVLRDSSRSFSDEAAAKAWQKTLRRVRVQLLLHVPAHTQWKIADKDGLLLDVVGFRVVTPCDGAVVMAEPSSQPVAPDAKLCHAAVVQDAELPPGQGPDSLTQSMVQAAMKPVVDAADACFDQYGVAGAAKLTITIGRDGTVVDVKQSGDFQDTPTGKCIDTAMEQVRFPRTRQTRTVIGYPIILR